MHVNMKIYVMAIYPITYLGYDASLAKSLYLQVLGTKSYFLHTNNNYKIAAHC